jgi:hypothetical protein
MGASLVAVGLSLREPWLDGLRATRDRRVIDLLEVMIDDARAEGPRRDAMRACGARWPLIAHGTELGIGDAEGVDEAYLASIGAAARALHVRWYSEHLAFLRAGGVFLGHFGPVGDDDSSLAILAANAAKVRARVGCPFLLENPADVLGRDADGPDAGARLGRAFARALVACEAGALLDLTNLAINARNDGYDAARWLAEIPWERVVEIHLAGGHHHEGLWIDSHSRDVDADARALLTEWAPRAPNLRAVIIERDQRIPALDEALAEVERTRSDLARGGRA